MFDKKEERALYRRYTTVEKAIARLELKLIHQRHLLNEMTEEQTRLRLAAHKALVEWKRYMHK